MRQLKKPDNLMLAIILLAAFLAIAVFVLPPYESYKWPPENEAKGLISVLSDSNGELKRTKDLSFGTGSTIRGSVLAKRLPIKPGEICMGTGQFHEDAVNGFECIGCSNPNADAHSIAYHGIETITATIAVVCNNSYDALVQDIETYSLDYSEGNGIKQACQICQGKNLCCAVILERA